MIRQRLVSSPCCLPKAPLEQVLPAYAALGFGKFEVFTDWAAAAFDVDRDPAFYLDQAQRCGMRFTSLHLPKVTGDFAPSLDRAIQGVRFAKALGVEVVLFKADTRDNYVRAAKAVLDACEEAGLTAVVQNHAGTAITSLEDYREVLDRIADDRLKGLFEVGHFHKAGVLWHAGYELLRGRIALVHIKDMRDGEPVPFGAGEIDFSGLFRQLHRDGYAGDFVVEIEKAGERTLEYLASAIPFLTAIMQAAARDEQPATLEKEER